MQSSALLLILFIHCSAAFCDLVSIISQSYHHFKATCSSRFSRWYYTRSIVRALKKEKQTDKGKMSSWVSQRKRSLALSLTLFDFSWGWEVAGELLEASDHGGNLGRGLFFLSPISWGCGIDSLYTVGVKFFMSFQ